MVARILGGGMIDRQGLLHIGDVILEVNNVPVYTPEELAAEISQAKESVTLKIGPTIEEHAVHTGKSAQVKATQNGNSTANGVKKLTVST